MAFLRASASSLPVLKEVRPQFENFHFKCDWYYTFEFCARILNDCKKDPADWKPSFHGAKLAMIENLPLGGSIIQETLPENRKMIQGKKRGGIYSSSHSGTAFNTY